MYKPALVSGIVLAMLGVILGAFAAHGLTKIMPAEKIDVFQKGVTYQFYHAFALILVGILYASFPAKALETASLCFILGVILFSGTLYLFPLMDSKNMVIPTFMRLLTPLGGLSFIIGWGMTLWGIVKN